MRIELIGHACHVIECGRTRLTIDPWLTDRLDRFWRHWPAIGDWRRACTSDAVLISHHHFDHHHFPSLTKLDRSARVYFPRALESPKFQGSGMGHQAIAWTLHAVGLSEQTQLDTMEWLNIGDLRVLPLPSRVHFPEVAFLIEGDGACVYFGGDTMLHPTTQAYFAENKPRVDVAFIPSHSIAPMEPLMLRCHAPDYDAIRVRSALRTVPVAA